MAVPAHIHRHCYSPWIANHCIESPHARGHIPKASKRSVSQPTPTSHITHHTTTTTVTSTGDSLPKRRKSNKALSLILEVKQPKKEKQFDIKKKRRSGKFFFLFIQPFPFYSFFTGSHFYFASFFSRLLSSRVHVRQSHTRHLRGDEESNKKDARVVVARCEQKIQKRLS